MYLPFAFQGQNYALPKIHSVVFHPTHLSFFLSNVEKEKDDEKWRKWLEDGVRWRQKVTKKGSAVSGADIEVKCRWRLG